MSSSAECSPCSSPVPMAATRSSRLRPKIPSLPLQEVARPRSSSLSKKIDSLCDIISSKGSTPGSHNASPKSSVTPRSHNPSPRNSVTPRSYNPSPFLDSPRDRFSRTYSPKDIIRSGRSTPTLFDSIRHRRTTGSTILAMRTISQEFDELVGIFDNLDFMGGGYIPVKALKEVLQDIGFDPRIIRQAIDFCDVDKNGEINCEEFLRLKEMSSDVVKRGLLQDVIIRDFGGFCYDLKEIYDQVKEITTGTCFSKSFLSPQDQERFGVAFCSIDGQLWHQGDSDFLFIASGGCFPIMYGIALEELGRDKVSSVVGQEPGYLADYELDKKHRPKNPMISLGAIAVASLIRPKEELAERFAFVMGVWEKLTASKPHFDNYRFLKDSETNDRKYSLAYLAKDHGGFDRDIINTAEDLTTQLRFHFMCNSIQVNVKDMAVLAATMARGGTNPITNEKIFSTSTVRDCLSGMFSCGQREGSGKFAFEVGAPAKTGTSGILYMVLPDVGGLAIWSPKLDGDKNSVRGLEFSRRVANHFGVHIFNPKDNQLRRVESDMTSQETYLLIMHAANGSLGKVMELIEHEIVDVNSVDYDGRTALHLAVEEKQMRVIKYLLRKGARADTKDRNGATALDLAAPHILSILENRDGEEEVEEQFLEKLHVCRYCGK